MLDLFLPYSHIDTSNPVFQRDLRRFRWLRSPQSLRRYTLVVILGIPLLTLGWWMLERANYGFSLVSWEFSNRLNTICIYGMIVWTLSNFHTAVSTISLMQRQFESDEWALLRITPQNEDGVLIVKDAVAQVYAWRLTIFEVGIRFALTMLLIINLIYEVWQGSADKAMLFRTAILNPPLWIITALFISVGLLISIEPLPRMRTVVSVCSAFAAQKGISTFTLPLSFFAVSLIVIPQAITIAAMWYLA